MVEIPPTGAVAPAVSVLIVDDQAPFRAAARAVVEAVDGFEVQGEAVTGTDAVAAALAGRPAVVLMDVRLPDIDGIEAARRVVAGAPGTMVVLLSTCAEMDLPGDARTCGAAAYLHKSSFTPAALRDLWSGSRPVPGRPV